MSDFPCYWLAETGKDELSLRRYNGSSVCPGSACGMSYHNARVVIGTADAGKVQVSDRRGHWVSHEGLRPPKDDPRWPALCACGYAFTAEDNWQIFAEHIYRRADTGEEMTLRDASPGALWDAWWWTPNPPRPDGICLMCKTPGGDWMVDSECGNCTRPGEPHYCWPRHGDPRDPLGLVSGQPLHVDKNGDTCAAGAGSILCGSYHGFLHHGRLVSC